MNPRIGWRHSPPSWSQPQLPGWGPLVDHGSRPLQAAQSLGRWWWPILAVGSFLAIVVQVLDRDPGPSTRGLLTIALTATVVTLLTIHRRSGPRRLARAVAEYTVVALLATLLAAVGVGAGGQPPADHAKPTKAGHAKPKPPATPEAEAEAEAAPGDNQPAVLQVGAKLIRAVTAAARAVTGAVRWLIDLWRQADQQAAARDEAMAALPTCPTLSNRRSRS